MTREYPKRPFVGVGAVVWRNGKVLLAERAKSPRRGHWSIPGGAQELGETLREAVYREVCEETGIEIRILGLVDVVDTIRHDKKGRIKYHYSLIDFAAIWTSGDLRAGDDASDCRWFGVAEAMKVIQWERTRNIILASRAFLTV